jgi:hypothetical protein
MCYINMIPMIGAFNSVLRVGGGKTQNRYTPRVDGQEPFIWGDILLNVP